jgi:hypothetical protein
MCLYPFGVPKDRRGIWWCPEDETSCVETRWSNKSVSVTGLKELCFKGLAEKVAKKNVILGVDNFKSCLYMFGHVNPVLLIFWLCQR